MSFQSYITFLIKNFHKQNNNVAEESYVTPTTYCNQWFGLIPFLFKWIVSSKS